MQAVAYPYQPVPERGTVRCFVLALLMHLLLGALLYYGVRWRNAVPEGVTAELWESVPEVVTPPPAVTPAPTPKPVEEEDADISLQEKRRKAERAARDEAQQARQRENQARADAARKEAQRKAQEELRQADNTRRRGELARLQAQAGGANVGTGSGTSTRPSSGYAERVRQRVKPNIIFNEDVAGNPAAVVAVHMAPDGSVLSTRLAKSSGNPGWDNAVLRAVARSDPLPRDENGVAPSNINITFWPKDQGG
ncbi:cell envelope integrity protein TolA [Cupriavidus consociatus]|uniref:cell envelope integrity protein TolA n=1 Tax=Cupriavidus consociatus TaxID=2821357 RepID=UPI001AE6DEA1|nr:MULTISPECIES: cell envelope integrity protein TolA [unclassified Cupriavidus]MBP0619403.1 cell envelope integrity protein TolA [Cupriavidus sp. LEh25]MDK2656051.1 cell envelope integrity protein TolA [Cupriavidus sp. LEh21]